MRPLDILPLLILFAVFSPSLVLADSSSSSGEEPAVEEDSEEGSGVPGVLGTSIEAAGEQLERSRDGILPDNPSGPLAPFIERFNSPTRCLAGKTICDRIAAENAKKANKESEEKADKAP